MFSLPGPPGPYTVGATSFTLPVRPARRIGTSQIRQDGFEPEPALLLEEVAFTAYYPADESAKKSSGKLDWLMRPLRDSVHGYSHFTGISKWLLWPIVFFFGCRVKIPAYTNTPPLRRPTSNHSIPNGAPDTPSKPWPLVIFSHGLGGGRTTYSQICANLASSGKVVLALEHRDGTSPVCRIGSADGKGHAKFYINPEHVIWDDKDVPVARLALREEQLDFRQRELCHAYTAFRKLTCKGERGALQTMDGVLIDWSAWMPSDTEQWVRCESNVALAGHSFGGATVFSVLSNAPLESEPIIQIPVSHAIALDPWLEPLAYPGPAPISADDTPASHTKLLVINAEGFTLWQDHYARLQEVVPAWHGSYVLTMIGAKHVSFSDFPVMLPRLIRDPAANRIIGIINELVLAFVDDRLKEALDAPSVPTRKMEIQVDEPSWWSKKGNRRLVGKPGDVIVH